MIAATDIERIASVIRDVNRTLLWARTRDSLLWRTCRIVSQADGSLVTEAYFTRHDGVS